MSEKICGAILAAGIGDRLKPFTSEFPKPMMPICNKPLLEYHIEEMKKLGIDEIFIVVKYLKENIINYFGDGGKYGVKISYVEQDKTLGIAHAVGQLENHINKPFLLFLGDIFFVTKNMEKMLHEFKEKNARAVLAVKEETNPNQIKRNFSIILNENGTIKRVIEKPRHLQTNLKGTGIYLFDQSIFDAIRRTPRTAMRDEYEITNSIQILIDDNIPIRTARVIEWDMNVTYAKDLLHCNLYQLKRMNLDKLIGNDCNIIDRAIIRNSVIGNNVIIKKPISIENSVVFSNTEINKNNEIKNSIITPKQNFILED